VGSNVAVGDVSGDGYAEIVTGANVGNPHVKVYSGKDIPLGTFDPDGASIQASWFPYELHFNVGASVAVGDVNGDGQAEVVTGANVGNPHVKVYGGKELQQGASAPDATSLLAQWFAYGLNFNVGANVAVGDVDGSGYAAVITGASAGNPDVHVYDGKAISDDTFIVDNPEENQLDQFFAYDLNYNIGVTVGAADFDGDGKAEVLTGASAGSPHYRVVKADATSSRASRATSRAASPSALERTSKS
jgi:FG-GAP repeat protein